MSNKAGVVTIAGTTIVGNSAGLSGGDKGQQTQVGDSSDSRKGMRGSSADAGFGQLAVRARNDTPEQSIAESVGVRPARPATSRELLFAALAADPSAGLLEEIA